MGPLCLSFFICEKRLVVVFKGPRELSLQQDILPNAQQGELQSREQQPVPEEPPEVGGGKWVREPPSLLSRGLQTVQLLSSQRT